MASSLAPHIWIKAAVNRMSSYPEILVGKVYMLEVNSRVHVVERKPLYFFEDK